MYADEETILAPGITSTVWDPGHRPPGMCGTPGTDPQECVEPRAKTPGNTADYSVGQTMA